LPTRLRLALLAGLALGAASACSEDAAEAPTEAKARPQLPTAPPAERAAAEPAPTPSVGEAGDASALLRRYYALLEQRRFEEAFRLREANGSDSEAFAAHFERLEWQKVTIGVPSEPVSAGGWTYVEVPVQTYGAMQDGKPFGSAGTVTLRRRGDGAWRIYTK
jgi:hypothetical protein